MKKKVLKTESLIKPSQETVSKPISSTDYNPDKAQTATSSTSNLSPVKSPKKAPVKAAAPTLPASSKNDQSAEIEEKDEKKRTVNRK